MANSYEPIIRPRPLQREEALELATDLLVKNPDGMGNADVFLASKISWLTDYAANQSAGSDDLQYFITAGENLYNQATLSQKDTRTFAECALMLAVSYQHINEDQDKVVYYQECATRCPEVEGKVDQLLGDALKPFETLVDSETCFPESLSMTEAGLAGANPSSDRAIQWTILSALARLHAGDVVTAQEHYQALADNEAAKKHPGFARLQKELKITEKRIQTRSSFLGRFFKR